MPNDVHQSNLESVSTNAIYIIPVHQSVTLQNRCLASPDFCSATYLIDNLNVIGAAPKIGQDYKPAGGTIQSKNYPDDYPNYDNQVKQKC